MTAPITDEMVDRCAEAAFGPGLWVFASDKIKDEWRAIARVILAEALRPAPADAGVFHVAGETGPLPGQEVLL